MADKKEVFLTAEGFTELETELDELTLMLDRLFGKEEFKVSKAFIQDLKKMQ